MSEPVILIEKKNRVGIIRLNRPAARNALSKSLMIELGVALGEFEDDLEIGAIIITGNDKFFSAGADIKEMTAKTFAEAYTENFVTKDWESIPKCRKPIIAAVSGFAVGGGCEIALSCDIIVADETAKFGQPEVKVGTIPGGGGTQRLARLVGKQRAMEMCLTGRTIDAAEASSMGIISQLVPPGHAMRAAEKMAESIASYSLPIVMLIKESLQRAFEVPLTEGLHFERRMLHATFALEDQSEAMKAFTEKRAPEFKHK